MKYELVFSELSEADAAEAIAYYDLISPDLGDRFLSELLELYGQLEIHPQFFSFIIPGKQIRDVQLPSFPYLVVYEIIDTKVYVIAVRNRFRKPMF